MIPGLGCGFEYFLGFPRGGTPYHGFGNSVSGAIFALSKREVQDLSKEKGRTSTLSVVVRKTKHAFQNIVTTCRQIFVKKEKTSRKLSLFPHRSKLVPASVTKICFPTEGSTAGIVTREAAKVKQAETTPPVITESDSIQTPSGAGSSDPNRARLHRVLTKELPETLDQLRALWPEEEVQEAGLFRQEDIPTMEQLEPVLEYVENRLVDGLEEDYQPNDIVAWPCSVVSTKDDIYLVLPVKIGEGGSKSVNVAVSYTTGKLVAASELNEEVIGEEKFDRIALQPEVVAKLQECRKSQKDNEGGILPIYAVVDAEFPEVGRRQVVLSKLCNNGDLLNAVSNDLIPEEQIVDLAEQIIIAGELLEEAGLIHRDVKGENFFVHRNEDGLLSVYLGDVDHADLETASSGTESERKRRSRELKRDSSGSWESRGPEFLIQKTSEAYTRKTEIYAFGLVLYLLIKGKQTKLMELVHNLREKYAGEYSFESIFSNFKSYEQLDPYDPWRNQEPEGGDVERMLFKMLRHNPNERCGSFAEVRQLFDESVGSDEGGEEEDLTIATSSDWNDTSPFPHTPDSSSGGDASPF